MKLLAIGIAALLCCSTSALADPRQQPQPRQSQPAQADQPAADASPDKCVVLWDPLNLCGKLTGNLETDLKRVADRVRQVKKDDLAYSILKAKAAGTPASKIRLQCLQAVKDASSAWDGDNIKDDAGAIVPRPSPAFITGIEDVAELVDALSPQGVLFTSCAGAAQMFAVGTLQVINAIATGAVLVAPK